MDITNTTNNKSCYSSGDSSASASSSSIATNTNADHLLRHLNKLSHKISKPTSSSGGPFIRRPPPEPPLYYRPPPLVPPPLQHQPPVYNINKSDFRDVVQKLTGSPAQDRLPAIPPHAPKPASSRLQRIRPPPLARLSNRPPTILNCAVPPMNPLAGGFMRPPPPAAAVAPLSPLPPFPSCHGAAESPISAYMRFLHNSIGSDPRFNNQSLPADSFLPAPSSPLPFGCLLSPKSPCPLLSPNQLFSPTGTGSLGFPQLPASPTVSGVASPKWRDL